MVNYNDGRIQDCLQGLKKIVSMNPNCPLDIWLAIGICHFKLKNLPKAKFALEHVIQHDPQNSMALTALGITELQINSTD
jgi:RNA polymerase-associated protein CTR9